MLITTTFFNFIDVFTTEHTVAVQNQYFLQSLLKHCLITLNMYKLMAGNVIYTMQFTVDKTI